MSSWLGVLAREEAAEENALARAARVQPLVSYNILLNNAVGVTSNVYICNLLTMHMLLM